MDERRQLLTLRQRRIVRSREPRGDARHQRCGGNRIRRRANDVAQYRRKRNYPRIELARRSQRHLRRPVRRQLRQHRRRHRKVRGGHLKVRGRSRRQQRRDLLFRHQPVARLRHRLRRGLLQGLRQQRQRIRRRKRDHVPLPATTDRVQHLGFRVNEQLHQPQHTLARPRFPAGTTPIDTICRHRRNTRCGVVAQHSRHRSLELRRRRDSTGGLDRLEHGVAKRPQHTRQRLRLRPQPRQLLGELVDSRSRTPENLRERRRRNERIRHDRVRHTQNMLNVPTRMRALRARIRDDLVGERGEGRDLRSESDGLRRRRSRRGRGSRRWWRRRGNRCRRPQLPNGQELRAHFLRRDETLRMITGKGLAEKRSQRFPLLRKRKRAEIGRRQRQRRILHRCGILAAVAIRRVRAVGQLQQHDGNRIAFRRRIEMRTPTDARHQERILVQR